MSDEVSLLTHHDWCKCIDPDGVYGAAIPRLVADERALDHILLTWDQFKQRIDEALI